MTLVPPSDLIFFIEKESFRGLNQLSRDIKPLHISCKSIRQSMTYRLVYDRIMTNSKPPGTLKQPFVACYLFESKNGLHTFR